MDKGQGLFGGLPLLWWVKFFLTMCALIFSIAFTVPTFLGDPAEWKREAPVGEETLGKPVAWYHKVAETVLPSSRISLGLDLKGGLHLVLEVDVEKSIRDGIQRAMNRTRDLTERDGIKIQSVAVSDDYKTVLELADAAKAEAVKKTVSEQTSLIQFDKVDGNKVLFVSNPAEVDRYGSELLQQAINTIRNRIDQFGVAEPNIFRQGDRRVVIQMPGLQDPARAKQLIGNTAQLDFRLVSNELRLDQIEKVVEEGRAALSLPKEDTKPETIQKISQWARDNGKISKNVTVILKRDVGSEAGGANVGTPIPYLVEASAKLTGDMIDTAFETVDQSGPVPQYAVSLNFNPQGSKVFGDLTKQAIEPQNAPHQIAIILDENITSAPEVKGAILGGRAQITMGRSQNIDQQRKDAQDLALVLRAGALPASVKIVEERQVGPSEGEENIKAGVVSSTFAGVLVVVFMIYFYGVSGLVANIAMLLNAVLILAFLAAFGATLTLPGIAGIVLTMAVAVDGNVIINERIREEMRNGLTVKQAFYRGYNQSFETLVDAHVTSAVAGIVLLIYGNPAVKGFAITLLAGIISTLFSSYYVTEVLGQWLIEKTRVRRFS
ncbi:MAG: protein translocase subunit SecD [Betaproteobacteria bacterium]|nr:protein translocase subunit SecD [Betaproteobacteria bacterium]